MFMQMRRAMVMQERFGLAPFSTICLVGENKTMHWHGSMAMDFWYYCTPCEAAGKATRLSLRAEFCSGCGTQLNWNAPVGEWRVQ